MVILSLQWLLTWYHGNCAIKQSHFYRVPMLGKIAVWVCQFNAIIVIPSKVMFQSKEDKSILIISFMAIAS